MIKIRDIDQMISFKTFSILIGIGFCLVACQRTVKNSDLTEKGLASLICSCSLPIVAYNEELRTLAAADDMGALTQKMTQGDQIMETAISCITDQLEKEIDTLEHEKIHQLLENQCRLDKRIAIDLLDKVAAFEFPEY